MAILKSPAKSLIKPRALKHGDIIGIAAPASPPSSDEELNRGIRYLEQLGYRVELGKHVYNRRGYLAGSDDGRAADLHQLFSNSAVKAIFCVRGGYGSIRLLPLLNYGLIRRNPKILMGYSDITALHLALYAKAGLTSFTGPMVAVEMAEGMSPAAEDLMWRALTSQRPIGTVVVNPRERAVYRKGKANGRLLGGNLTMISSLVGSRFFPRTEGHLLLLEEVDERPYRIDRMLNQMKRTKLVQGAKGIVLGKFTDCEPASGRPSLSLEQVIDDVLVPMNIPIGGHLQYGHIKNPLTLPIGVRATLDASKGTLKLLEAGVR